MRITNQTLIFLIMDSFPCTFLSVRKVPKETVAVPRMIRGGAKLCLRAGFKLNPDLAIGVSDSKTVVSSGKIPLFIPNFSKATKWNRLNHFYGNDKATFLYLYVTQHHRSKIVSEIFKYDYYRNYSP